MKQLLTLSLALCLASCSVPERNNPLDPDGVNYIGDLPIENSSSSLVVNSSSSSIEVIFGDPVEYENETYETVVIGEQTWFKRNLNVVPSTGTSMCYEDNSNYCETYGRLYDWATAMALPSECNEGSCDRQIDEKHKGICPDEWHIPSYDDWSTLMEYVDPSCSKEQSDCKGARTKLISANLWKSASVGTDDYGFSALPGGFYGTFIYHNYNNPSFTSIGYEGYWWSSTEGKDIDAFGLAIGSGSFIPNKSELISVRCLKD